MRGAARSEVTTTAMISPACSDLGVPPTIRAVLKFCDAVPERHAARQTTPDIKRTARTAQHGIRRERNNSRKVQVIPKQADSCSDQPGIQTEIATKKNCQDVYRLAMPARKDIENMWLTDASEIKPSCPRRSCPEDLKG
jgi:hypothetical protein